MSFLTSLVSWCPAEPLPLGEPFAASSAVADATFQAELGTSARGIGLRGELDRSNCRQILSSARRLRPAQLRRESYYSRYRLTNIALLLLGQSEVEFTVSGNNSSLSSFPLSYTMLSWKGVSPVSYQIIHAIPLHANT